MPVRRAGLRRAALVVVPFGDATKRFRATNRRHLSNRAIDETLATAGKLSVTQFRRSPKQGSTTVTNLPPYDALLARASSFSVPFVFGATERPNSQFLTADIATVPVRPTSRQWRTAASRLLTARGRPIGGAIVRIVASR